MKPRVLFRLPQDDVDIFFKIRKVVENFPDRGFASGKMGEPMPLSCHLLARAIGKIFGLKYVDGHSFPGYQHTWLVTSSGNIIDVYPVATLGGPIILDGNCVRQVKNFYKKKRLSIGASNYYFRLALSQTENIIRCMV